MNRRLTPLRPKAVRRIPPLWKCLLGLWLCLGSAPALRAQENLAPHATADTTRGWWYRTFKADYPDPKKAATLSLALPGAGQLYNKRWWKLPLVYGAMGGMVYSIDYNTRQYRRFSEAYILALKGEPHEFVAYNLSTQAIKRYRDQFDKRRQLSWIGLVAVHLLQAAEAFVDAHLMQFDLSEDLSLQWRLESRPIPSTTPRAGNPAETRLAFVLFF